MTIAQLAIAYGTIAFSLTLVLVILFVRSKSEIKKAFIPPNWRLLRILPKEGLQAEFWLKMIIATCITISAGVIIALTALSYGTVWAMAEALIFAAMLLLLPKVLA
jgi:hypothetical protein